MIRKFVELTAGSVIALSLLGFAYGSAGTKDEAFKILERLDGLSKDRYVGSFWREASIQAGVRFNMAGAA